MDPKRQRVLDFFSNELEQYVLGDLILLSKIRPDKETGFRGCAVPQAMLIFAILDLLGYLIDENPGASKTNTLRNYKTIFSSKHGLFPIQYEKETDRIVKLFRHGIMHQFFPKAAAVAKVGKEMPLISTNKIPCLNVDKLSEDVVNAIRELGQLIASGNFDALVERINTRLNVLATEDFEELAKHC